ncbi:hypothetical protein J6590_060388, partial [Homalodisca vitripennis]
MSGPRDIERTFITVIEQSFVRKLLNTKPTLGQLITSVLELYLFVTCWAAGRGGVREARSRCPSVNKHEQATDTLGLPTKTDCLNAPSHTEHVLTENRPLKNNNQMCKQPRSVFKAATTAAANNYKLCKLHTASDSLLSE